MAVGQIVTDGGLANLTNRSHGAGNEAKYVGWGTGTTTPAHGDTDLATPSAEARTSGTVTRVQTTVANDTLQIEAQITSLGSQTITEVGLFESATTGILCARAVHAGRAVLEGDSVTYTLKIPLAQA